MIKINKALIPNEQVLKASWEYLNNKLVIVSKGLSSKEQQEACYSLYEQSNCSVDLSKDYVLGNEIFELWVENELVGLCKLKETVMDSLTCADLDNADKAYKSNCLYLSHIASGVFILPKYQGKGLGTFFADTISSAYVNNVIGLLINPTFQHIKQIDLFCMADYESEKGERFHLRMTGLLTEGYLEHLLSKFKVGFDCSVDVGY